MTLATYKWSVEEWHELIESGLLEGKPVELLNGDIIVRWSAPPLPKAMSNPQSGLSPEREEHSYTNDDVAELLREKLRGKAKIRKSYPITLDNSEPEPDIAIVRLPKTIYTQHHSYPEDIYWLIEVSKKTLKIDLEQKSQIYARNKIPEYWIIDLVNKKLIVRTQPKGDRYLQNVEYKTGTIASQAFPDMSFALDDLLLF